MATVATKRPKKLRQKKHGAQRKAEKQSNIKTADEKGRVVLGKKFKNRTVILEQVRDTEILVRLARVIPERGAWLCKNPIALAAVRKGLAQARAGQVVPGPDLEADAKLAAELED